MSVEILAVPAFETNYIWILHDKVSNKTVVVDPGEAAPVFAALKKHGWTVDQIWNTHWHKDHTGGNEDIKAETGCDVIGPAHEKHPIPGMNRPVDEGDEVAIGSLQARVMAVPAHTVGHVAYYLPDHKMLFCGDTLFAMGCGRLFEGTADQMWQALQRFSKLPPDTKVYCGHEYTQDNGHFALTVDPDNLALQERVKEVDKLRADKKITLPSTIALEWATNPFMRTKNPEELAKLREAKDNF
ncbi:MAG: hydroxyacylglutathione hydrolase [Zymomonas mobilis subsp. pomaceae]|uniref:Hydroxyacylglutathione hydrolase n=1 Tax=Zymomonas mobilis subsp. pomaceae (strain ATCC 29192 / DSM 22645 / JCM 10191 / CCUG 17912 / NBRC 13757 / NCIMB 11200 / NRRL B-4491 / Barker I) TaxID=579138 RepID=F8EVI2_ZYMMT|nr:hydroxyacylglutathione hydrolase [Zymomonas mobilis]AEI37389.1 hydroxyacylglutathione hydrolase [Zymomonas mobilis subsp. pomaceae ATCC 29192]MDX5948757.1 hydroxyacylglutathione hydrolase [Zymomonas mobilis subsp. pomaceae]GEB88561.1 hydroxyacylglutathione hydrolase [Zymomonas mobilis subsp. pomaceae]